MAEIATLLGISRQRATELSLREGFPKPYTTLSTGRVWLIDDIVRWAKSQGRDVNR